MAFSAVEIGIIGTDGVTTKPGRGVTGAESCGGPRLGVKF